MGSRFPVIYLAYPSQDHNGYSQSCSSFRVKNEKKDSKTEYPSVLALRVIICKTEYPSVLAPHVLITLIAKWPPCEFGECGCE